MPDFLEDIDVDAFISALIKRIALTLCTKVDKNDEKRGKENEKSDT